MAAARAYKSEPPLDWDLRVWARILALAAGVGQDLTEGQVERVVEYAINKSTLEWEVEMVELVGERGVQMGYALEAMGFLEDEDNWMEAG